jgi:hypothetical protein
MKNRGDWNATTHLLLLQVAGLRWVRIGIAIQRRILIVLSLLYMLVVITDLVLLLAFFPLVVVRFGSRW